MATVPVPGSKFGLSSSTGTGTKSDIPDFQGSVMSSYILGIHKGVLIEVSDTLVVDKYSCTLLKVSLGRQDRANTYSRIQISASHPASH